MIANARFSTDILPKIRTEFVESWDILTVLAWSRKAAARHPLNTRENARTLRSHPVAKPPWPQYGRAALLI